MTTYSLPASILGVALLLAAHPTRAETITLNPVADTSLFSNAPNNNAGGNLSLAAGNTAGGAPLRALLRFDPAGAIPPGARITSASLQLQVVRTPLGAAPATFDLHRVFVGWGEGSGGAGSGSGTGTLANNDEATWNARFHPTFVWSTTGGEANADFAGNASASADNTSTEPLNFTSTPELVADVQSWLETPRMNFGWMIKDRSEGAAGVANTARRLASREDTTRAPALTIEFELIEPLSIRAALDDSGNICFRFNAKPGKAYKLLRRELIDSGEWTTVGTQSPSDTGGAATLCDALNVNAASRFYRVSEE